MIEHYKDDKSTVFSIVPYLVHEFKPGLYPGEFKIEACLDDTKPNRLVVGASEHLMHNTESLRPTRLVTPSFIVATSIVADFLDGQLWTTPDTHPGITWLQGDVSVVTFLNKHKEIFDMMRACQHRWYVHVCNKTNDEWNKFHHSRVVSNQARFAARVLGLEPEWLTTETIGFTFEKCPACGTPNNVQNAVCSNCRCILNEEKYKVLKFAS